MLTHSHKTVIVLDRSPRFSESSRLLMDLDVFMKSKVPGIIPLQPIAKSLWTCNVEAALEYARIVYDIFPSDKLIKLVASDIEAFCCNSWMQESQSLQQLLNLLAEMPERSPDVGDKDCSIIHGLDEAIQSLCEPSPVQHQKRTSLTEGASALLNRGRIICLTSLRSKTQIDSLEQCLSETLLQKNRLAAASDNLIPLTHCEVVLIDVVPLQNQNLISARSMREVSPLLSCEVQCCQSGLFIATRLIELAMRHHNLSITTVTGIPMKEEQNASSSANYDVELLHSVDVHDEVIKTGKMAENLGLPVQGHIESLLTSSKEGLDAKTVTLKWCTPKSNAVEMQQCTGVYRITPVDVSSRPSLCLTNFLLSGRTVFLEQPRKSGAKVLSHMLTSHGGEIYIHVLATARSMLEEPPSISEGAGGRITDYRINDFGVFMKDNKLVPVTDSKDTNEQPIERAKKRLERLTRHWPMVFGSTVIFNMTNALEPLLQLVVKETLTDDEVLECKKVIYHVVAMESRNETLLIPASTLRGKGSKRDDQYRQLWAELEQITRSYHMTSANHEKVLECIVECKRPTSDESKASGQQKTTPDVKRTAKEEKMDVDDSDSSRQSRGSAKDLSNAAETKPVVETKKPRLVSEPNIKTEPSQSLLTLWNNKLSAVSKTQCREFAGRLESEGNIAELYQNLKENGNGVNAADRLNSTGKR